MSAKRVVDFPDAWGSAPPIESLNGKVSAGVYLAGVLLEDGSNLWALIYPGGARFVRTAAAIDWGIEERYTGTPPREDDAATVNETWALVVGQVLESGATVDQQYADAGLPPYRKPRRKP